MTCLSISCDLLEEKLSDKRSHTCRTRTYTTYAWCWSLDFFVCLCFSLDDTCVSAQDSWHISHPQKKGRPTCSLLQVFAVCFESLQHTRSLCSVPCFFAVKLKSIPKERARTAEKYKPCDLMRSDDTVDIVLHSTHSIQSKHTHHCKSLRLILYSYEGSCRDLKDKRSAVHLNHVHRECMQTSAEHKPGAVGCLHAECKSRAVHFKSSQEEKERCAHHHKAPAARFRCAGEERSVHYKSRRKKRVCYCMARLCWSVKSHGMRHLVHDMKSHFQISNQILWAMETSKRPWRHQKDQKSQKFRNDIKNTRFRKDVNNTKKPEEVSKAKAWPWDRAEVSGACGAFQVLSKKMIRFTSSRVLFWERIRCIRRKVQKKDSVHFRSCPKKGFSALQVLSWDRIQCNSGPVQRKDFNPSKVYFIRHGLASHMTDTRKGTVGLYSMI